LTGSSAGILLCGARTSHGGIISPGFSGPNFFDSLFSTIWPGSFLGSFFPQERVFNNFSASFLGSFRFVFWYRSFVINNFSGSFLKKGILFYFFSSDPAKNLFLPGGLARKCRWICVSLVPERWGLKVRLPAPGPPDEPV
jgi:hypothetical protein